MDQVTLRGHHRWIVLPRRTAAGIAGVLVLAACLGMPSPGGSPQVEHRPVAMSPASATVENSRGYGATETLPAVVAVTTPESTASFAAQARIAFASDRAGAGDIFVDTAEGGLTNLTRHPAGDWDPAWSPACADPTRTCRIAFTSHRSGDSEIWTMDIQGRNLRNITQHPAWDYWPAWSPDGQRLAFVSERDGDPELYIQAIDGEQAIQLTLNAESDRLPAWSPDGSRIAFAAVRNGVEAIHVISVDCAGLPEGCAGHERPVTAWPLKGTAPAWSPDGRRIAFIGWNAEERPGIYIIGPTAEDIQMVWEANTWIGSLTWAPDPELGSGEGWLLFSSWQDRNHEIYAMPSTGGTPTRLTAHSAWDDFPSAQPGLPVMPRAAPLPEPTPSSVHQGDEGFAYGVNMADLGKAYLVSDLGFGWVKSYVNWETVEPERGQFRWVDPDNIVKAFEGYDTQILMRVHGTPSWARPGGTSLSHPPDHVADFAHFMTALATRYRGQVAAYEIWNEPNLDYEWGYLPPDPARYTALLKEAYAAVKAADPDALIISAGLATTGDGSPTAMGDLVFLQGMYDSGAKDYFDALGSHPYAFGHKPDYEDPWGLSMARVVQQREVMVRNGDAGRPIWITELGWVLHTSWNLVEHEVIAVDEAQQAEYLARAYQKVRSEWPWVQGVFLFNLDFSSVPWYVSAEPMRWYAILNPDRTPRPAYTSLRHQMMESRE